MAWDSSLQPRVQRGASGFELASLNIQQHAHRGSARRTQIIRFADPCFGLLQITVLEVPMGQRDATLGHGVGLQGITCGLASLGASEATLSMPSACRKVAPTLWPGCRPPRPLRATGSSGKHRRILSSEWDLDLLGAAAWPWTE